MMIRLMAFILFAALALRGESVVAMELDESVTSSPEYKKCILQKELSESQDAIKTAGVILKNNREEAKVVGYTTLRNQANMNQNKKFKHQVESQADFQRKELRRFSKANVNCKELETNLRATMTDRCIEIENSKRFKIDCNALKRKLSAEKIDRCNRQQEASARETVEECKKLIESDPDLNLWKR